MTNSYPLIRGLLVWGAVRLTQLTDSLVYFLLAYRGSTGGDPVTPGMNYREDFTAEAVEQLTDERAYSVILTGVFQMVSKGLVEMSNDKNFGQHVDRVLHNFAATLYQKASDRGTTVDQAATSYEKWLLTQSSQDTHQRAGVLLYLKAWRHRKNENGGHCEL